MELKDIDPVFVIGVLLGLALLGAAALYLQGQKSANSTTKRTGKAKTTTPVNASPPRIKKDAVGSVATPAGRRSARLARKAD